MNRINCAVTIRIAHLAQHGLTLIELMVTVSVIAIIAAIASPSLMAFIERARLQSATQYVYEKLITARTESTKQSRKMYLVITTGSEGDWGLGMSDSPSSGCDAVSSASNCIVTTNLNGSPSNLQYAWTGSEYAQVALSSSFGNATIDPVRGVVTTDGSTPNTLTLTLNDRTAQISITGLGRVEISSP